MIPFQPNCYFQSSYICTLENRNKMIEIGKYNTLTILRDTKVGFFRDT
jgi:hypothetical protein